MMISNAAIGWILAIAGTFGVNYAQIQVNTSDIVSSAEQNKERYDNIQKKLDSIENFLRGNHDRDDEENDD